MTSKPSEHTYTCGPVSCEPSGSSPLPRMGGRRAAGGRQAGGRRAVSPRFREWPLCVCVCGGAIWQQESHIRREGERERDRLAGVSKRWLSCLETSDTGTHRCIQIRRAHLCTHDRIIWEQIPSRRSLGRHLTVLADNQTLSVSQTLRLVTY